MYNVIMYSLNAQIMRLIYLQIEISMLLVWSEKVGVVRVEDAGVVDSIIVVSRLAACDVNVNICLI